MTFAEQQAQIAKEITIALASKLHIQSQSDPNKTNEDIICAVCDLYEKVFDTVKKKMEE